MAEPKVSVLIPCYNAEQFIQDCIDSVLSQDFQDFEVILVDDGSDRPQFEYVSAIGDSRIKTFTKEHSGIAATLNYGLQKCAGEFVARMDADDTMRPDRLKFQVEWLGRHTEYSVLSGVGVRDGIRVNDYCSEVTIDALADHNPIVHPSVMFRRHVIASVFGDNVYSTDYICEDYDLWARCVMAGLRMYNVDHDMIDWRVWDGEYIVRMKDGLQADDARVRERIRKYINEFEDSAAAAKIENVHVFTVATGIYNKYLEYQFNTVGNLFPGKDKTYNVISDREPQFQTIVDPSVKRTEYYHICNLPYPLVNLNKFTYMCDMISQCGYSDDDYFVFVDADTIFCDKKGCTDRRIWEKIQLELKAHGICYALSPHIWWSVGIDENSKSLLSCAHINGMNGRDNARYAQASFLMGTIGRLKQLNAQMCNMQAYDLNANTERRLIPYMGVQTYMNKAIHDSAGTCDFRGDWYIHDNYDIDQQSDSLCADFSSMEKDEAVSTHCICMQKWAHQEKVKYKQNSTSFDADL